MLLRNHCIYPADSPTELKFDVRFFAEVTLERSE